jgi:hypothetical protein
MNTPATPLATGLAAALTTAPAPTSILLVKRGDHKSLVSFENTDKGALLSSIFLRRSAMPELAAAKEIRVTIEISA